MTSARRLQRKFTQSKLGITAIVALTAVSLVALFAGSLIAFEPTQVSLAERLQPPSGEHLLGTDRYGRDVLSRVVRGTGATLSIGLLVILVVTLMGTLLGITAAFFGSWVDWLLMRFAEVMLSIPTIILAIGIAAVIGPGQLTVIVALSIVYTPRMARIVRGTALRVLTLDFVQAARGLGAQDSRLITRHVFPSVVPAITVQGALDFSQVILVEAALSFLGLGEPPPAPTLGNMLAEGRDVLAMAPWVAIFPGLMIFVIVLCLNIVGDTLRDVLDPRTGSHK